MHARGAVTRAPFDLDPSAESALTTRIGAENSLKRDCLFWDTKVEQAVRKGKWKLLVTKKPPNPKLQIVDTPIGEFLFNLETDPGESENLIKQHPETAKELKQALQKWSMKL